MAARRHLWILVAILAATTLGMGQPAGGAGANTGQSLLAPPEDEDTVAEPAAEAAAAAPAAAPAPTPVTTQPASSEQTDTTEDREVPRPGGGAEDRPLDSQKATTDPYVWWKTVGALALVIGLIFCAKCILRRLGAGRSTRGGASIIEVLTRTSVSARHSVILLRVGSRLLLVAAGSDGMNTLTEIDDPEQVSELLGAVERAQASSLTNSFARALRRERVDIGDDADADAAGATAAGGAAEQIKGLLSRVRNMGPSGRGRS